MGKPKDPDYWKKWRAAHPESRAREVVASKIRKRKRTPESRRAERARALDRANDRSKAVARRQKASRQTKRRWLDKEENRETARVGWRNHHRPGTKARADWNAKRQYRKTQDLAQGHIDRAHEIAREYVKIDHRTELYDDLYEEAVAIAVLSIWEWKNMPEHREKMAHKRVKSFVSQARSYRAITLPIDDGLGTIL